MRHIVFVFALSLLLIGNSSGQPQQPSPSGREKSQPNQSNPQASQQSPAIEQRGTNQAPLTTKILPAQNTDTEGAKKYGGDGKTTIDWVALFTLFLFVAAAAQVLVLIRQLRYLAKQAKAMVTVESPIPEIADIKLVEYKNWDSPHALGDRIAPGPIPDFCRLLVHIKNFGRSSMHITSFCIEKGVYSIPTAPDYKNICFDWQPWLAPQDALWFMPRDALIAVHLSDDENADIQTGKATFWVYGYITYLDVLKKSLTCRFLARWDFTKGFIRERRLGYTDIE